MEDGNALEACVKAVSVMEDLEGFNAGFGSVLNEAGEVEMDAAVMKGNGLKYGAVAAISKIEAFSKDIL